MTGEHRWTSYGRLTWCLWCLVVYGHEPLHCSQLLRNGDA